MIAADIIISASQVKIEKVHDSLNNAVTLSQKTHRFAEHGRAVYSSEEHELPKTITLSSLSVVRTPTKMTKKAN